MANDSERGSCTSCSNAIRELIRQRDAKVICVPFHRVRTEAEVVYDPRFPVALSDSYA